MLFESNIIGNNAWLVNTSNVCIKLNATLHNTDKQYYIILNQRHISSVNFDHAGTSRLLK